MAADTTTVAATAVAGGVTTLSLAVIGIDAADLLWVAVGAGLGITATPPMSRVRAVVTFVATCFAGALLARIAAQWMWPGDDAMRRGCALVIGLTFPAIKDRLMAAVPVFLDVLARRSGADK